MNVDSNSESNGLRRSVGHGLGTDVSLDHLTELAHSEDEVIRVAVALHPALQILMVELMLLVQQGQLPHWELSPR